MIPNAVSLPFVALVFALYLVVLVFLWRGVGLGIRGLLVAAAAMCLWLGAQAYVAASGALVADVLAIPPTLFRLVVGPAICAVAGLALLAAKGSVLARVPADWLVSLQAFRIPMELILYGLYLSGHWNRRLTFEGANFDIATGAFALVVGYLMHKGRAPSWLAWCFHLLGMTLLSIIVGMAILSAPTPMLHFADEPLSRVIFHVPFVWLPGFVVPIAWLAHILGVLQLLRKAPTPPSNSPTP